MNRSAPIKTQEIQHACLFLKIDALVPKHKYVHIRAYSCLFVYMFEIMLIFRVFWMVFVFIVYKYQFLMCSRPFPFCARSKS